MARMISELNSRQAANQPRDPARASSPDGSIMSADSSQTSMGKPKMFVCLFVCLLTGGCGESILLFCFLFCLFVCLFCFVLLLLFYFVFVLFCFLLCLVCVCVYFLGVVLLFFFFGFVLFVCFCFVCF